MLSYGSFFFLIFFVFFVISLGFLLSCSWMLYSHIWCCDGPRIFFLFVNLLFVSCYTGLDVLF
ncbi:hypothetical protein BC829DRAFT_282956 [Chytridium lagenaria]|nr:hypothetical protein BC829DRAFT_282956 [Chytridium lagenaria]